MRNRITSTSVIAGGAGFIGSHLVDRLVRRGENVLVLDDLTTGRLANLADAISSGRVTFIYADSGSDAETLRDILQNAGANGKIDTIFHFTSPSGSDASPERAPAASFAFSGVGMTSLIDIAVECGARFVLASPSAPHRDLPDGAPNDHGLPPGEAAVGAAVKSRGLDACIVRFFDCYGPRMQAADGQLIPTLIGAAIDGQPFPIYGTGAQTCSPTYVMDAIELLLLATATKQHPLTPLNIGTDAEHRVIDIAKLLARVLSIDFDVRFIEGHERDGRHTRRPDLSRARNLGWLPQTSLVVGLRATHRWYLKESRIFV